MPLKEKLGHEDEIPEEHPTWKIVKRIFIIIIGLFLFYLIISYFGLGEYIFSILIGQLTSDTINEENTIFLANHTTITFSEEAYQKILELYGSNQKHEFAACLSGTYFINNGNKTYLLTKVNVPEIFSQEFNRVISVGCDNETLIFLHSHPYKHCLFSTQDLDTHKLRKNPVELSALMCEEDRFTFYGY